MTLQVIETLLGYSDWANRRVLDALAQLPHVEIEKSLPGAPASPLKAMAHVAGAELIWLQRWKGESPRTAPEWVATADLEVLGAKFNEVREERNARIANLGQAEMSRRFSCTNLKGDLTWNLSVGDMLLHVANHGTHHRGQVVAMIRQLGFAPPPTDLIIYANQSAKE